MLKQVLKTKWYIFIGTMMTAGLIVGITYNFIQANNKDIVEDKQNLEISRESNNVEDYDNLQKQIDELRLNLEKTNTELEDTKQELANAKGNIYSLNNQMSSVKKLNKNKTTTTSNSDIQGLSKQLDKYSAKDSEQKELLDEKVKLEEEFNILYEKQMKYYELYEEKNRITRELNSLNIKNEEDLKKYSELEEKLKSVSKQVEDAKLTGQEEKRLDEVSTRITEVKEKLLEY